MLAVRRSTRSRSAVHCAAAGASPLSARARSTDSSMRMATSCWPSAIVPAMPSASTSSALTKRGTYRRCSTRMIGLPTRAKNIASSTGSSSPRAAHRLAPKLRHLVKPVQEANKAAENIARAAGGESSARPAPVVKTEVNDPYKTLAATPRLLASVLAVVLLTFFFMVYGQSLQRNALALLPDRQQKRLTVEILQSIEREISRYVLTISIINALVGLALAAALYWLGVAADEALLWGTMAALLNFAPYVGPLIGILIMLLMGFVAFDDPWRSLLPAAIYLGLHTLEGQLVTPIVLGARMALSPLVLILALMLFGWLWGIVGLLLAVPLLVCVKIVLAKIEGMEGWAKLLE